MPWKVKFLSLLLFSSMSYAQNSITITDEEEIEMADRISAYLAKVSRKVMECTEKQNNQHEGCTCQTREICPFKKEYDEFTEMVCLAFKRYPNWKTNNLIYDNGHIIGTINMNHHYGKHCK